MRGLCKMKLKMKLMRYIIPLVAAMILMAVCPVAASANSGLQVSNMILVTEASPGETLAFTMTTSIGAADPAADITVQVEGLAQSLEGTNGPLAAADDTGPYSARSFITVDKSSFHLEPGASQEVTATINVPQDVGEGGRYAIIHISTQPVAGAGVNILTAIDVPVVLTITGSQLVHTGQVTAVTTGEPVSGQPLAIFTTFKNTGNHHFKIKGEVTVSDSQGKLLGIIDTPLSSSIVPGMSRQLRADFSPQSEIPPGVYSVASKVMLGEGTIIEESKGSITVGESGLKPVSATAVPSTTPASSTGPSQSSTPVLDNVISQSPVPTSQPAGASPSQLAGVSMPLFIGVVVGAVVVVLVVVIVLFIVLKRRGGK
jgi:hypothetical protein